MGFEPLAVGIAPDGARAGAAHIAQIGAAFHQQAADQQLRAFVAAERDAALDRRLRQRALDRGQEAVLGGVDLRLADIGGGADGLQPGFGAVVTDRRRADDGAAGDFELAHAGGVEGVDRGDGGAIERGIQLTPFARRHHRTRRQTHRVQQHPDDHRVGREHLAQQRDRGPRRAAALGPGLRRLHRAGFGLAAGIFQHRAGQHVLGLGMRGHAETGHVDADDAHAVDLFRQDLQRHAAGGRHAQIDDHDRVVERRIGLLVDRFADVLEQLAGDQALAVEGHVADAAARAVEMRGEGQAIDAAGRARQDRRGAAHAQTDAQRAEGRAHALRLVVRAGFRVLRIVLRVLREDFRLAGRLGRRQQRFAAGMATHAISLKGAGHLDGGLGNDRDDGAHGLARTRARGRQTSS